QPLLHSAYLAGIWREDLHRELLWHKASSAIPLSASDHELLKSLPHSRISQTFQPYRSRRTSEFCPPTWSWASVRGAVSYDGIWVSDLESKLEDRATILDVHVNLAGANPTGSVKDGQLTLLAPLAPVRLGFYEEVPRTLL